MCTGRFEGCVRKRLSPRLGLPFCAAPATSDPPAVVFGSWNWTRSLLQTLIAHYIVEHGYGYAAELYIVERAIPLLRDLRDGDIHLWMEVLPARQTEQWEAALSAGDILNLGTSLVNVWQSAFVIPAYLQEQYPGLDHVEDLKQQQYKSLFSTAETGGKARLVSCVVGWACEQTNREQIAGYGLQDHCSHSDPPPVGLPWMSPSIDAYENERSLVGLPVGRPTTRPCCWTWCGWKNRPTPTNAGPPTGPVPTKIPPS